MNEIVRNRQQFGQTIRKLRKNHEYNQSELADRAGITQAQLSRIETNEKNPTLDTAFRLLGALDHEVSIQPRPEPDPDDDPDTTIGGVSISP